MGSLKESKQALGAEVIAGLQDFAPPTLLAQASRLNFSTRLFNLIVTNVPGPQFPLYLLGREMERIVPIAFLPENHALAIAIMSYNGKVDFGLLGGLRRDARPRVVRRPPRGVARGAAEGGPQEERLGCARQRLEEGDARQGLEGLGGARAGEGLAPATLLGLMKKLLVGAAALLAVPGAAQAAPPNPFGHTCTPQNGVLFCPTANDTQRVPSFDGVPIDVDVTLPPSGDGPFPAIVMMHGWGGNKRSFQATTPEADGGSGYHYNNVYFAQQGYAVITPSARGFGRSCGAVDSRTSPGLRPRLGAHLADHRYEVRDTQHLLGLLADQGVIRPRRDRRDRHLLRRASRASSSARLRDRIRLAERPLPTLDEPARQGHARSPRPTRAGAART